jgi:hypothetical protein
MSIDRGARARGRRSVLSGRMAVALVAAILAASCADGVPTPCAVGRQCGP